jgi:hypothetical protein
VAVVCIQCAMKAKVEGKETPRFEGTVAEHMAQFHPDLEETKKERKVLESRLAEVLRGEHEDLHRGD